MDYVPAKGNEGEDGYVPAQPGGLGEEDMVTLVLPYAKSARDGVRILGDLLERYGTYENNGIAFSDVDEIWWLETIGGHHWIAKRVPDDAYVTIAQPTGYSTALTWMTPRAPRPTTCVPPTCAPGWPSGIWT